MAKNKKERREENEEENLREQEGEQEELDEEEYYEEYEEEYDEAPGEDAGAFERAQYFIQKNRVAIIGGSIAVIALIAGLIYWQSYDEKQEVEAANALTRVMPIYKSGNYQIALDGDPRYTVRGESVLGLKALCDKYGGTPSGKIANFYAGSCYLNLNKPDDAVPYFEAAADAEPNFIKAGAKAGMASCRELKGKRAEAAKLFAEAAELSVDDATSSRYNYYAALNLEKSGDKTAAEKIYKEIVAKDSYSKFANYAKAGLIRLGTIIE